MVNTGLQQIISSNLDGARSYPVDIKIYSGNPRIGVISATEILTASMESVLEAAEETLQGEHALDVMTIKFPGVEDTIECFRDGEGIICRKA
jgi:hypothetical protein